MELRDIEYFGVIATHGSMRRAAEALGLTPPALTKSLRRLETAMEARLVDRTGKGVRLTPLGEALAAQALRVRLMLDDITREASDLNTGRAGHLRIGSGPTDCELLPDACARLMREAPRQTMEITISDNDELVPLVRDGKLDFSFNFIPDTPYDGVEQIHIRDDEYVAYASIAHPLAKRRKVELVELVGERWASSTANYRPKHLLIQAFSAQGLPEPIFAFQARSVRLRMQFIARLNLIGFGPRHAVESAAKSFGLKVLPIKVLTMPRRMGAIYRKAAYLPPSARRLIQLLKE